MRQERRGCLDRGKSGAGAWVVALGYGLFRSGVNGTVGNFRFAPVCYREARWTGFGLKLAESGKHPPGRMLFCCCMHKCA